MADHPTTPDEWSDLIASESQRLQARRTMRDAAGAPVVRATDTHTAARRGVSAADRLTP